MYRDTEKCQEAGAATSSSGPIPAHVFGCLSPMPNTLASAAAAVEDWSLDTPTPPLSSPKLQPTTSVAAVGSKRLLDTNQASDQPCDERSKGPEFRSIRDALFEGRAHATGVPISPRYATRCTQEQRTAVQLHRATTW